MKILLSYIIQVNIAIVLFYLLYKILFQRDTFFYARRWYLLGAVLFSFIYPFLPIDALGGLIQFQKETTVATTATVTFGTPTMMVVAEEAPADINWTNIAIILYVAVSAIFLLRFLWQFVRLVQYRRQSEVHSYSNITYRQLEHKQAPFSFFKWIFVDANLHSEEKLQQVLIHEHIHSEQWHSLDVILSELTRIFFWWNPFVWLMKKEIVINLEYIADNGVLGEGVDRRDYQYHLLHLTYPATNLHLTNNFNVSQLKQRITMMNSEKTPIRKLAKYALVLPLALLLITANSVYAQQTKPKKVVEEITLADSYLTLGESSVSEFGVETDNVAMIKDERSDDNGKERLTIRGMQDSISGKPLIIIDGVKMSKDFKLNEIKPEEIESMTILKDQSATSQYGEDGKDGVIIISKKKNDIDNTEQVEPKEMIFVVVEDQPEFPGGNQAMMDFISNNIKYPAEAKEKGIQGRVILNYVVEEDGSISEVQVVRGVAPMLDSEAIRVIESMPKWKPGKLRGKEVRVRFTLPVVFRIPSEGQVQDEVVINYKEDKAKNNNQEEIFVVVENQPEFPGGNQAMMEFLGNNINYPVEAQEKRIQGRVILNFVIEKDGAISEIQVVRGVDPSLDMEATRVVGAMPKWKPGTQRGQAVRVRYTLPIAFRLPDAKTDNVPPPPPAPAKFPGGDEAMFKYMAENIKYPVIALENGIQGLVEVVYNVDKNGKVSVVKFNKTIDPSLDREARRVMESMPKWEPGIVNNKPSDMTFVQSFVFRLQGENVKEYSGERPDNAVIVVGYSNN